MPKIPYFPFYPDDWISSPKVMLMTMEQRGIYITLLSYAWNFPDGVLPDNMSLLQRFCHGAKAKNIAHVLDTCFERRADVGWTNPRMLHERSKVVTKRENISQASKIRESQKKQYTIVADFLHDREDNQIQIQNQKQNHIKEESKDMVAKTKKQFLPPTIEDVKKYCSLRGNKVSPETFVDFYESKGWMVGKNKMKDWKAAVRTWEKNRDGKSQSFFTDRQEQNARASQEARSFFGVDRECDGLDNQSDPRHAVIDGENTVNDTTLAVSQVEDRKHN